MLFNLTKNRSFPVNKGRNAIKRGKYYGPSFGGGLPELSAFYEPFNADEACWSEVNLDSFRIPVSDERINMLTNLKCVNGMNLCSFTISELEVWGISFKE